MNYNDLKINIENNVDISNKIYICNFLFCNEEKMKSARISVVKNIFCKFVVTKWLDYEYNRYSDRKVFRDKNAAANYAWELFKNLQD